MAPQGAVCFLGICLHPSCLLLIWLGAIVATQWLGYVGLLALVFAALLHRPVIFAVWLAYLRRSRWLLLTLWLIMAFNTPGDALFEQPWAPTEQGISEASLQGGRLMTMLVMLAWVFAVLGRERLVAALWGLFLPLRHCGWASDRLVVRLGLVLDHVQHAHAARDWKRIMQGEPPPVEGPSVIRIELPSWQLSDALALLGSGLLFLGAVLL